MNRTLAAVAACALLALTVSGCGGKDAVVAKSSGGETSSSASSSATTSTPSDTPTSEAPTDATTPSDSATEAGDSSAPPSGGRLDACQVVTKDLLNADLGTTLNSDGSPQASSYGDPNAVDCYYFLDQTTVVAQASTRADQDTPQSSYDIGALPGAKPIPGAARGYAYVLSSDASSSVGTVFVVKGQESLNLAIAVQGAVTIDQLVKVGTDVLAAM